MVSEQEMMADLSAADAAGDTQLAQTIATHIRAARTPQVGMAGKALQWLTTPSDNYRKAVIEPNAAAGSGGAAFPLTKDSGDARTAAQAFVSGLPGYQRDSETPEAQDRMGQFANEHRGASILLPMAAGFANPMIGPGPKELPASPNILRRAAQATITPTPEAAMLQARGVPLTMGQLNPRSAVGQIEEASQSLRGVGSGITAQRNAAKDAWQQLVMREAHPPMMPQVPPNWKLSDALQSIYEGFKPSYEAIGNEMIYPAIHGDAGGPLQGLGKQAGAMERAALDPSVLAPDATRQTVNNFLQNQMTILPQYKGAVGQVGVRDLLQVRSNIRDAIRQAVSGGNHDVAQLLTNGEDAITSAVESQASPSVVDALRQTDSKYHAYKVVEDAVARAADSPSGFSPSQLSNSIKGSMGKGQFARGGGGELRDLSSAGKSVFESVSPPTGARLLTVGPLGELGTGPAALLANRAPSVPWSVLTPEQRAFGGLSFEAILSALRSKAQQQPSGPVIQQP